MTRHNHPYLKQDMTAIAKALIIPIAAAALAFGICSIATNVSDGIGQPSDTARLSAAKEMRINPDKTVWKTKDHQTISGSMFGEEKRHDRYIFETGTIYRKGHGLLEKGRDYTLTYDGEGVLMHWTLEKAGQ